MRVRYSAGSLSAAVTMALAGIASFAQQQPGAGPGAGRALNAPPPIVWPSPPLADGPIVLDTGIQRQIRLVVTAENDGALMRMEPYSEASAQKGREAAR